jgi:hypothetical protein
MNYFLVIINVQETIIKARNTVLKTYVEIILVGTVK